MQGYKFDCEFGIGRHGFMIWPKADEVVGGSLRAYGEYSPVEVGFMCKVVQPGMVVFDIGANLGSLTVPMARKVGERGTVLAFEPQPALNKILMANVAMNEMWNTQVIQAMVGNKMGSVKIPWYDYSLSNNYGAIGIEQWKDQTAGVETPIVTVDSLAVSACHVMKIDAEGFELEVLEGAEETIKKFWPFMFVENDRAENSVELIRKLRGLGYKLLWFRSLLFSEKNFYQNPENIFGGQASFNMVCIPPEGWASKIQIDGLQEVQEEDSINTCVVQDLVINI